MLGELKMNFASTWGSFLLMSSVATYVPTQKYTCPTEALYLNINYSENLLVICICILYIVTCYLATTSIYYMI